MLTMIESDSSNNNEAMEKLLERMRKSKNNQQFLDGLGRD